MDLRHKSILKCCQMFLGSLKNNLSSTKQSPEMHASWERYLFVALSFLFSLYLCFMEGPAVVYAALFKNIGCCIVMIA